jgi:hypothetical protein
MVLAGLMLKLYVFLLHLALHSKIALGLLNLFNEKKLVQAFYR